MFNLLCFNTKQDRQTTQLHIFPWLLKHVFFFNNYKTSIKLKFRNSYRSKTKLICFIRTLWVAGSDWPCKHPHVSWHHVLPPEPCILTNEKGTHKSRNTEIYILKYPKLLHLWQMCVYAGIMNESWVTWSCNNEDQWIKKEFQGL